MAKKKKGDGITFVGMSSNEVTGSCYHIQFAGKQMLLECGLYQASSNDYLDSYKINSRKFPFKPSEISYIFVEHCHIDHIGLLPRLVKEGFNGKIVLTDKVARIAEALLRNCAFIVADEARILSKRYNRDYSPLYTMDDVERTLDFFYIYDQYNTVFRLDDNVSFQWFKNSHCLGAAQIQLILKDEQRCKKILYTSDIGAINPVNHYLSQTEIPNCFNDYTIMESTYGSKQRTSKKTRKFDKEHLKTAVETVFERNGSVIIPCFSFSRTQEILTVLYEIFGSDTKFKAQVVVDSMLSCEISNIYSEILSGDNLKLWNKVTEWENVRFISDKAESDACVADDQPKIVISSSGFCTNGRILKYLEKYIADENSIICLCGYCGDNPSYLAYRIKNYKDFKQLKINHTVVENKADCISLYTFSSHANHDDLVKFGSSLKTEKLILVHGSEESKLELKEDLQKSISKNDKSYKVLCSSKDMFLRL